MELITTMKFVNIKITLKIKVDLKIHIYEENFKTFSYQYRITRAYQDSKELIHVIVFYSSRVTCN